MEELSPSETDESVLVAIAATCRKLGLGRTVATTNENAATINGNPGDPFMTLGRSFP